MERILKTYMPSAALTFTLTLLVTCIWNLCSGYEFLSSWWILQVLGFIVIVEIMDYLLGMINFQRYWTYFLAETLLAYGVMLIFAYFGGWFSFTPGRIFEVTVIFFIICFCIHGYFRKRAERNVEEINCILRENGGR